MLLQNLRFGARMLVRHRGQTVFAGLTLSVGIGLTATMFSILHGTFLRGLPFEKSHQLLQLGCNNLPAGLQRMPVTPHDFFDWRAQQSSFEDIAAWAGTTITISGQGGPPERYNGAYVSSSFFELLRVQPSLGRTLQPEDASPETAQCVVISDKIWRNRFAGDPRILGKAIRINGEMTTLVGVMPAGFAFPLSQDFWLPLRIDLTRLERGSGMQLQVFGRLKSGISLEHARAEIHGIAGRLAHEYPTTNEGVGAVVNPYVAAYSDDELRSFLQIMLAAVFGVLLIACGNVANLILARATLRTRELGVRAVLGADRLRIVSQLLTETLMLGVVGGLLGLAIAKVGSDLINKIIAPMLRSFWIDVRLDLQVVLFVVGLTFAATLISGVIPAAQASGTNVSAFLKDQTGRFSSFRLGKSRRFFVVAQISLSCGLLIATGLMIRSLINLKNTDYGFATGKVFTAQLALFGDRYAVGEDLRRFYDELLRRIQAIPEAHTVALTSNLPADRSVYRMPFVVEGGVYSSEEQYFATRVLSVTPGYLETFGVKLLAGRNFRDSDDEKREWVGIVTESFAKRYVPGKSPLGQRIGLGRDDPNRRWISIVGVIPDSLMGAGVPHKVEGSLALVEDVRGEESEGLFLPLEQSARRWLSITIRTRGAPLALTSQVREAVAAIDPDLPIFWVKTMSQELAEGTWLYRLFSKMFIVFGVAAFLLAMIGLYGVMASDVNQRSREFGIRIALGAQTGAVLTLVLRRGLIQLGIGVVLGLGLAAVFSGLLTAFLFEVRPWDYGILVSVMVAVAIVGLLACLLPALRALRMDPLEAIRYE